MTDLSDANSINNTSVDVDISCKEITHPEKSPSPTLASVGNADSMQTNSVLLVENGTVATVSEIIKPSETSSSIHGLPSPDTTFPCNNNILTNSSCIQLRSNVTQNDKATTESSEDTPREDMTKIQGIEGTDKIPTNTDSKQDNSSQSSNESLQEKDKMSNSDACGMSSLKNLTISTVSLNENFNNSNTIILTKTPFSKSAENVSNITEAVKGDSVDSSISNLDEDKILNEFMAQKNKVSATQKIVPDILPTDSNSRLPKEILSQDLGSIVKNVHGIFSSMSGSLKNAYNISHRASQKPAPKLPLKNLPNNKILNEIFNENPVEDTGICENLINEENKTIDEAIENTSDVKTSCDAKTDVFKLQVESLEKLLSEQRKEMSALRERVKQQADDLQQKDNTFKDLEGKMDLMRKRVEQAEKEKASAVMRYAQRECSVIEAQKAAETAQKAEKNALGEMELMTSKLKSAHAEKQRICQMYDDKCHELQSSEREVSKLREDLKELEGRLKWTQSKLRVEMDAYKDSAEKVEKLQQQVSELETAKEAAASGAEDSARARALESELNECQAALILCRHERTEMERKLASTAQALAVCTRERDDACSALSQSNHELSSLRAQNSALEQEAAELAALRARAHLADSLEIELDRERGRAAEAACLAAARAARAEGCAAREAAALAHAARASAAAAAASVDAARQRETVEGLTADNTALREQVSSLEEERTSLADSLKEEADRRLSESRVLARKVAELTEELSEVNKQLEWERGENSVLKKKHASTVKELNRELQRAMKRCAQLEAKLPQPEADHSTRSGSVSSINSSEGAAVDERLRNGHLSDGASTEGQLPDRQTLIERIVQLQRTLARRGERCDFLEEHNAQLTAECRSKARLLRHALTHQQTNGKREVARLGGGAMAAVWGADTGGVTLELAVEMNNKLQAVLEDALHNNIMLKETVDTLGKEIARLKTDNASSGTSK